MLIQKRIKISRLLHDQMLKCVEGIDKMIDRCKAYVEAGAEIIFPEALHNEKEF